MAPKSPWKQNQTAEHAQSAAAEPTPAVANYNEMQREEIEVLQAIFIEDYEDVAAQGAWSKTTDRTFKLTIRSSLDADALVVLSVRMTATYPRTAPVLNVQGLEKFHERTGARISDILQNKPKQMLGEAMIHGIAEEIRDALEDAIQARAQGALPSLAAARATAEEVANKLARQEEEAEARRLQQAQDEEDRMLKQMVVKEMNRQERRKSKSLKHTIKQSTEDDIPDTVSFGQTAKIKIGNEYETFTEVAVAGLLFKDGPEAVYLGRPIATSRAPIVAVKTRVIQKSKSDIIDLESTLAAIQKLEHPNLLNIMAYRVNQVDHISELYLCREYADRGSLHDLLSVSDLRLPKARHLTTELLQGLEYLHQHGVTHGLIDSRTVYLTSSPTLSPKLSGFGYAKLLGLKHDDLPPKWQSPDADSDSQSLQRKRDIFDLGVVVVQMFLGVDEPRSYSSPSAIVARSDLTDAFTEFLKKMFSIDTKKPVSCFDLLLAELLRIDASILQDPPATSQRGAKKSSSGIADPINRRSRHNSSNVRDPVSRYLNDFTELGRLGKGGFGEVVRARHKLDQSVYAVKKIKQAPQFLERVLQEVVVLNKLNHPYVVRYYTAWIEAAEDHLEEDAVSSASDEASGGTDIKFGYSNTGGLDFVSSSHPGFEFAHDEDNDDDADEDAFDSDDDPFERGEDDNDDDPFERGEDDNDDDTDLKDTSTASGGTSDIQRLRLKESRSDQRLPSTLYIQMELCDRRSLRDLIRKGMSADDQWRFSRQITEGLASIHASGIIHRDLKPDNVFIDNVGNPKVGDFGLATTGQYKGLSDGQSGSSGGGSVDMTKSIGTAMYVAPELHSTSHTSYNDKVDMYSLGIIIYEMCQTFGTAMERIDELQRIRQKRPELPSAFQADGEKAAQGRLISCLISHKPSDRPSSAELLRDDRLPVKVEDETMRKALSAVSDASSPFHQQIMSALFAHDTLGTERGRGFSWDTRANTAPDDPIRVRLRAITRSAFETVAKCHGAEEVRRDFIFPRTAEFYNAPNVMQLLDASGNLLQLPYDLTLPYARQLARQPASTRSTFTISGAYRDPLDGGPPRASVEADFDIVNEEKDVETSLNDAEVLKVMDKVLSELPFFAPTGSVFFHLTHGILVDAIMDFCRVPVQHQRHAKEALGKLNFQNYTWPKVRQDLRNMGISDTTLQDLTTFDWREPPEKAWPRLQALFNNASARIQAKMTTAINELRQITDFAEQLGVARKLHLAPLSCFNVKFYATGMLFQCVVESTKKQRLPIAAGGRYDSLIRAHEYSDATATKQGAVGLCVGVDTIVGVMMQGFSEGSKGSYLKDQSRRQNLSKRCDVLVVATGTENVRRAGVKIVASLWDSDISAELAREYGTNNHEHYLFLITLRHETSPTVRFTNIDGESEDVDIAIASLVGHVQQELRDRAQRKARIPLLRNHSSHQEVERKGGSVQVLKARHGSKKGNNFELIEGAHARWAELLEELKGAPILAIESPNSMLDLLQGTSLGDQESWRKATQRVAVNERQYLGEIREVLEGWRKAWVEGSGMREACVYNFRTQRCIYYDLGA